MENSLILLVAGLVLLVGLFGRVFQRTTKLPESVFLILFGVLLGPVFGLIPASAVLPLVPIVSTLALVIILLESGVTFEATHLDRDSRTAALLIVLVGVLTTAGVGALLHWGFGWDIYMALLVGLVSSGTTTLTARTLLETTDADRRIRRIITLETVFNDVTLVLGTMVILEFMQHGGGGLGEPLRVIASQFSVGLVLGAAMGWAWKGLMERLGHRLAVGYIATLGFCLVLYYASEALGGNAVLSIFAFSLVLGNHEALHRRLFPGHVNSFAPVLGQIKRVQGDFAFFMRAFFFFLLGVSFSFQMLGGPVPWVVGGIIATILVARFISSTIASLFDDEMRRFRMLVTVMIPRGFVATVLAFVPAQRGVEVPQLPEIVLLLVFATTLVSIGGTYAYNYFHPLPRHPAAPGRPRASASATSPHRRADRGAHVFKSKPR